MRVALEFEFDIWRRVQPEPGEYDSAKRTAELDIGHEVQLDPAKHDIAKRSGMLSEYATVSHSL